MTDYRNALPLGTRLDHGKYVLDAVLGEGGFGVVYRARHGTLGTMCAIKEYLPVEVAVRDGGTVYPRSSQSANDYEDGLKRFIAEARHLVRLEGHPNIVRCTDFFQENGTAYLVMAYEDGASLDKVLAWRESKGEPLEESEALAILCPLLNGLARVHAEDMLHRDIKPANVFIRRRDQQPVLLDFGAAKQEFSHYSKSKAQAYTEGYAPAEQIEHDGTLGPWTDLYSVGALMWRIATGNHPPDAMKGRAWPVSRGRPDSIQITADTGNGRFSESYLSVMGQCLALDEARRPQSVADVLERLGGEPEPEPVEPQEWMPPGEPSVHEGEAGKKTPQSSGDARQHEGSGKAPGPAVARSGNVTRTRGGIGWWVRLLSIPVWWLLGVGAIIAASLRMDYVSAENMRAVWLMLLVLTVQAVLAYLCLRPLTYLRSWGRAILTFFVISFVEIGAPAVFDTYDRQSFDGGVVSGKILWGSLLSNGIFLLLLWSVAAAIWHRWQAKSKSSGGK